MFELHGRLARLKSGHLEAASPGVDISRNIT
jgi:hypothetical protein